MQADLLNELEYTENAALYGGWAVAVMEQCRDRDDARFILRRPSQHGWPLCILKLAVEAEAKSFIAHQHVQSFVDDSWRGRLTGSDW